MAVATIAQAQTGFQGLCEGAKEAILNSALVHSTRISAGDPSISVRERSKTCPPFGHTEKQLATDRKSIGETHELRETN